MKSITYTGSNAYEVEAFAKQHGYHATGLWPGEAGKPLFLTLKAPVAAPNPTIIRVEPKDILDEHPDGGIIFRRDISSVSTPHPLPATAPASGQQQREDSLREIALEQAGKQMSNITSTRDVYGSVLGGAERFLAFLKGDEEKK